MAAIDTTRTYGATGIIGRALAQITTTLSAWLETRATRNALSQLDDRMLEDIGLNRGEVNRTGIYH